MGIQVVDRQGRPGTITAVDGTICKVKLDETGRETSFLFWMLASAPAQSAPSLKKGAYRCYHPAGAKRSETLLDFVVDGPKDYRDKQGEQGKYRAGSSGELVFEDGPLAKFHAKVLPGGKIAMNRDGEESDNMICEWSE